MRFLQVTSGKACAVLSTAGGNPFLWLWVGETGGGGTPLKCKFNIIVIVIIPSHGTVSTTPALSD